MLETEWIKSNVCGLAASTSAFSRCYKHLETGFPLLRGLTPAWLLNLLVAETFSLSAGSRSRFSGLPGVPAGQRGAQRSPHAAAGDQSPERPVPVLAGGRRQRHLQDEQLLHGDRQATGTETGGQRSLTLQVANASPCPTTGTERCLGGTLQ